MIVEITVGDWTGDGHGLDDHYFYDINLDSDQKLREAHNKGSNLLNINLDKFCKYDQDPYFPCKIYDELVALGLPNKCIYSNHNDAIRMTPSIYVEAYMLIAKSGNPLLEYKKITSFGEVIHLDGYGLYN